MEDTLVKPGHYAYQFRVDISHNEGLTAVMVFIKHYDVKFYIVGAETSDHKKQHFQCILWFKKKVNSTKLRNWWKGKTLKTKQPVSLTSAKKIENLAKYTMKENNFTTNLTQDEVKSLGKWSQKLKKVQWAEALDEHAKKYCHDEENPHFIMANNMCSNGYEYENGHTSTDPKVHMYAFIAYMLDFYKENQKRPARASLQYLAWKHGYMSNCSLIKQWF